MASNKSKNRSKDDKTTKQASGKDDSVVTVSGGIFEDFGVFDGWPGSYWLEVIKKRYGDNGKGLFDNRGELVDYLDKEKLACQQLQAALAAALSKAPANCELGKSQAYTVMSRELDQQIGLLRAINYLWLRSSTAQTDCQSQKSQPQKEQKKTSKH